MSLFKTAFGTSPSDIQTHCVILPSNDMSLFPRIKILDQKRGKFFSVIHTPCVSFITTRFNLLIGDCVLSLKETKCQNIYLFGACGALQNHTIGDIVTFQESVNYESVTHMLTNNNQTDSCFPDQQLTAEMLSSGRQAGLKPVKGCTVSSLILEETRAKDLIKQNIECVDMESSVVFSAAQSIHKKAVTLLYVTDIIGQNPFYQPLNKNNQTKLNNARKKSAEFLMDFIPKIS